MGWRMKLALALGASLILLGAVPAAAQSYPGEDVTVNPGALGNGYLLYPGGKYGRLVGKLLQPGEKRSTAIHLHMPRKVAHVKPRKPRAVAVAPDTTPAPVAAPAATATVTPPPPWRVAKTTPPPRQTAAATPPSASTPPTADISAMPEDSAARLVGPGGDSPPPKPHVTTPRATATAVPVPGGASAIAPTVAAAPPPKRIAKTTPPPAATPSAATGLRKQSVIPFAVGSASPAAEDVNAIQALAAKLTAALNAGAERVQLEAYGGPRGDKSSDSRRLSLKRALVVRELLIEDGVPSEKIDVRAMGGTDDSGAPDRVDVLLRG